MLRRGLVLKKCLSLNSMSLLRCKAFSSCLLTTLNTAPGVAIISRMALLGLGINAPLLVEAGDPKPKVFLNIEVTFTFRSSLTGVASRMGFTAVTRRDGRTASAIVVSS